MTNNVLRLLARKYNLGQLEFEAYRESRAELIEDVISGREPLVPVEEEVTAQMTAVKAPAPLPVITETEAEPPTLQPRMAPTSLADNKPVLAGLGIAAVVVIGLLLWWLIPSGKPAAPAPPATVSGPAEVLVEQFLQYTDWSANSLEEFMFDWDGLTDAERDAAEGQLWFRRLADAAHEQLLAERTMAELGGGNGVQGLINFAEYVDLHSPTLDPLLKEMIESQYADATTARAAAAEAQRAAAARDAAAKQAAAKATAEKAAAEKAAAEAASAKAAAEKAAAEKAAEEAAAEAAAAKAATEKEAAAKKAAKAAADKALAEAAATEAAAAEKALAEAAAVEAAAAEKAVAEATATAKAATENAAVEKAAAERAPTQAVTAKAPGKPAAGDSKTACHKELLGSRRPYCRDTLGDGSKGPKMAIIPAGNFMMGSDYDASEQPVHEVSIGYNLAMSTHEITRGEYSSFCRHTGRDCVAPPWPGDDYPAVNVSWDDANDYTRWLSQQTGKTYRLPTEAEWEYAARAGSSTPWPAGDELLITDARFSYQKQETSPLPVSDRSVNRNAFRLYHMVGNVREWVMDTWKKGFQAAPADGSARRDEGVNEYVVRGGAYTDVAVRARSAVRAGLARTTRDELTGFRVVQLLDEKSSGLWNFGTDNRWLNRQQEDALTLQLFVLSRHDNVEKLVTEYRNLGLRVVSVADESGFVYRVLYGLYDEQAAANVAWNGLPTALRKQSGKPVVKTVGELRSGARASLEQATNGAAAASTDWFTGADDDAYLLQLVAVNDMGNARSLIGDFENLGLRLLTDNKSDLRYRVVYGLFETSADAKAATAKLPQTLLDRTGRPVIKSVAELRDSVVVSAH